eukprot:14295162-Ditylum_brightwellii.AAC.1
MRMRLPLQRRMAVLCTQQTPLMVKRQKEPFRILRFHFPLQGSFTWVGALTIKGALSTISICNKLPK